MTSIDHVSSSINAMRMQEESAYRCVASFMTETIDQDAPGSNKSDLIDADCRSKMIKWCYQIVDFCKYSRETVAISVSYLDRFVLTPNGREATQNRKDYQLAAMACLYTAVKLHEPTVMDPKIVASLSRGVYSEKQITDMEFRILSALQWRVNPPTPLAFVRLFFSLMMSSSMTPVIREELFQCAQYQTELALSDFDLIAVNPSATAYAAIANALENSNEFSAPVKSYYLNIICNAASIDRDSFNIKNAQERLRMALSNYRGATCSMNPKPSPSTTPSTKSLQREDSWKESPRGVATEQ